MRVTVFATTLSLLCLPIAASAAENDASLTLRDHGESTAEQNAEPKVRLGVMGSVGFPRPIGVEALMRVDRVLALGVEYSVLPTTSVSGVSVNAHAIAADARFFPAGGPFFVGLRAGRQHIGADASLTVMSQTYSGSITHDSTFLNPRVGFLWTWRSGLSIGLDAGLQIPLGANDTTNVPNGVTVPSGVDTALNLLGRKTVPTVSLLQLGFLF